MNKKIEKLKQKIEERNKKNERDQKIIDEMKPADGWYVNKSVGNESILFYMVNGEVLFGIDVSGKWHEVIEGYYYDPTCDYLITEEEAMERLTAFVNKKGYRKGVTVKCYVVSGNRVIGGGEIKFSPKSSNDTAFMCVSIGIDIIWRSDLGWAKIVEQKPKYMVRPNKLGFEDDELFSSYTVLKDGKILDYNDWVEKAKQIEDFLNK